MKDSVYRLKIKWEYATIRLDEANQVKGRTVKMDRRIRSNQKAEGFLKKVLKTINPGHAKS